MKIRLDDGALMPVRAHMTDAGLDLFAPMNLPETVIPAGESAVIDTGVHIRIPNGYVGMLKSKSGLNVNHGIINEGVIDAGYTGSIRVKLYNMSKEPFLLKPFDKISQLVILPILIPELEYASELGQTERGEDGFGSTGRTAEKHNCETCYYLGSDYCCEHPEWMRCKYGSLWTAKGEVARNE